jgi:hypothetical protein
MSYALLFSAPCQHTLPAACNEYPHPILQAFDNDQEERAADIIDAYVDSSADESDDEKEKEEDEKAAAEKKEQLEQAQASLQHLEGGAAQLESAMEFKHKVLTTRKEKEKDSQKRKLDKMEGDTEEAPSARKSSLVDKNGNTLKKGKHVSIAQEVTTAQAQLSSSSSSKTSSTALNEENVRAYMKRQGGRVQSKVLKKVLTSEHLNI